MRHLLFILIIIPFYNSMGQTEEQKFTILEEINKIQIREYDPVIYASVTSKDNNNMFRILAGYIFGGNDSNQKIAMTAPVHMQEANDEGEDRFSMKFVMPSKYELDDLSIPDDSRIKMEKIDKKKYAAISYSGYNNQEKFNSNFNRLREILDQNKISYFGNPIYLGYDAPYKFWGRRNEVLLELN